MKESKITGWKDVCRFTFVQTMREKSTRISLIIFCVIILFSVPVVTLIKGQVSKGEKKSKISTVYVLNKTNFTETDFSNISTEQKKYSKVKFETTDRSIDDLTDLIIKKEKNAVILEITDEDASYMLHFTKNPNGKVKDNDLNAFIDVVKQSFEDVRVASLNITKEQYDIAYADIKTNVYIAQKEGVKEQVSNKDTKGLSDTDIVLLYVLSVVPFFFLITGGSLVAGSIIIEKSSKVIEYLMLSIRPLAIVLGKVIAMFSVIIVQLVTMGVSFLLSVQLNDILFPESNTINLGNLLSSDTLSNINIGSFLLILIMFLFGFLFYSVFASLFGATVSKIEELQEGLSVYSITALVGFYLSYILIGMNTAGNEGGALLYVACLLPISSPFIVPGYLILGKISIWLGLGSLAIQVVVFVLLTLFVSKVYETLILHYGSRIKIKNLITIFKS